MNASTADHGPLPVTKTAGFNYRALLSRVVVIGLLSASLGLLWWSYYREYAPRLRQSREVNATVAQLSAEVDDLDGRWTPASIAQLNQKFALVQPRIFTGRPELESWLADFQGRLNPLKLDLKTDFASASGQTGTNTGVFVIPATISVKFQPLASSVGSPTPFQRLLQLGQFLTSQEKSGDFTELTVESGTNSIDRAVLGFNFWAGTPDAKASP